MKYLQITLFSLLVIANIVVSGLMIFKQIVELLPYSLSLTILLLLLTTYNRTLEKILK